MENKNPDSRILITAGDPAGIGPELLAACSDVISSSEKQFCVFFTAGSDQRDQFQSELSKRNASSEVTDPIGLSDRDFVLNSKSRVLIADMQRDDFPEDWSAGNPGIGSGLLAFRALESACDFALAYGSSGMCTAPISKEWISKAVERDFPGHTDYLSERFSSDVVMLMYSPRFSVIPITIHIPLSEVPYRLKEAMEDEALFKNLYLLSETEEFRKKKWALCGVNPHAGEGGYLGKDEAEYMDARCRLWKERGLPVEGPLPADAVFLEENLSEYSLVLSAYHDQGLIPFKALAGREGVNCTIGLPFLRTSPDHGTAFSLAGKGQADPLSMRNALHLILTDSFNSAV